MKDSVIRFRAGQDLKDFCEQRGEALGGNASTFLRSLVLQAKADAAVTARPVMDDDDAHRESRGRIVSLKQLRAEKAKAGKRGAR